MLLLGLMGCSPLAAEHVMAWVRGDDGSYRVGVRALPELSDPVHMIGELGTIRHGGRILSESDGTGSYTGGLLSIAACGVVALIIVLMLGHDSKLERPPETDSGPKT